MKKITTTALILALAAFALPSLAKSYPTASAAPAQAEQVAKKGHSGGKSKAPKASKKGTA
jgi:hypothetical protein